MSKEKALKVLGLALAGLVGFGGGFALMANQEPVIVEKNVTVGVPVEVPGPVQFVDRNVTVEKQVIVEDESFKLMACDRLQYDIVSECVEEIKSEDKALQLAFELIKSDFQEELKDADLIEKRGDAELQKVYSDFEDINVTKSDFDRDRYEFVIKVKVEDTREDDKFHALFTVKVEDSEATIESVDLD
jgi:hypothetical protein